MKRYSSIHSTYTTNFLYMFRYLFAGFLMFCMSFVIVPHVGAQSTYDVEYVRTVLDGHAHAAAPSHNATSDRTKGGIARVEWTGQYFVAVGSCGFGANGKGGLYLFSANGDYIGQRDLCDDMGDNVALEDYSHFSHSDPVEVIDGNHVVIVPSCRGSQAHCMGRSPVYYELSSSGIRFVSRAHNPVIGVPQNGTNVVFTDNGAVANGMYVTSEFVSTQGNAAGTPESELITDSRGRSAGTYQSAYSLPSFNLESSIQLNHQQDIAIPASRDRIEFAAGIGDIVIGSDFSGNEIYTVSSNGVVSSTGRDVEDIAGSNVTVFRENIANNTITAIKTSTSNMAKEIIVLSPSGDRLKIVDRIDMPSVTTGSSGAAQAGDFVVMPGGFPEGERYPDHTELYAWRDGEQLSVEPISVTGKRQVDAVAVSPNGTVLVVASDNSSFGDSVHVFRVTGGGSSYGGGGITPFTSIDNEPFDISTLISQQSTSDIFAQYGIQQGDTNTTVTTQPSPEDQILISILKIQIEIIAKQIAELLAAQGQ